LRLGNHLVGETDLGGEPIDDDRLGRLGAALLTQQ
jgi:hypothetical protein